MEDVEEDEEVGNGVGLMGVLFGVVLEVSVDLGGVLFLQFLLFTGRLGVILGIGVSSGNPRIRNSSAVQLITPMLRWRKREWAHLRAVFQAECQLFQERFRISVLCFSAISV